MYKKLFTGLLLILMTAVCLAGCGDSSGKTGHGTAWELIGTFCGPAGSLIFYEGGEVLVNLSDDYVWFLEEKENNRVYGYVFIHRNEKSSYDIAEYIFFHDNMDTFAKLNCLVENDKIVLYPGGESEAVFERQNGS